MLHLDNSNTMHDRIYFENLISYQNFITSLYSILIMMKASLLTLDHK